ncbi:MAG: filamentous hemagglutinin N-terminal domain-containing protein, partial [Planctomycetota bacterium]|nr:filamentous hemagglutinin N-terminal domain-containing protein [Planctomycetota bacterium]
MKARIALLLGWLAGATAGAVELPRGGTVTSGAAGIGGAGNTVNIDQSSDRAAIRWDSFNIGAGGVVNFHQPGAGSLTLNRVLDLNGSKIFGQLNANGRVFILNPNGVLFGPGARVNVGGLAASTKDLADGDFLAGDYRFTGGGSGEVVNQGILTASPGGFIALIGNRTVANYGTINAELGTAALAAGQTVRLNLTGDGLAGVEVDGGTLQAMVANRGAVMADGGRVYLTAKAADALVDTVVSNTGLIQARTLENRNGEIWLLGGQGENEGGTVEAAGRLDAGAPAGGDGGF